MWKGVFLCIIGASYGLLAAAGVFTVLVAVGLVPRFAGETHTAHKVLLYEEMVIFGTIAGTWLSVFERYAHIGAFIRIHFPRLLSFWDWTGLLAQAIYGVFSGMFVGCLALAIAEMLDSIPIFARRISFRHGIGLAVLAMAAGKFLGAITYFWYEF